MNFGLQGLHLLRHNALDAAGRKGHALRGDAPAILACQIIECFPIVQTTAWRFLRNWWWQMFRSICSFPISQCWVFPLNMVIFHGYVAVYQRVNSSILDGWWRKLSIYQFWWFGVGKIVISCEWEWVWSFECAFCSTAISGRRRWKTNIEHKTKQN